MTLSRVSCLVALVAAAPPAFAHHGTLIACDRSKQWTSDAVVTSFHYANPHPQIFFDVTRADGNVEHWSADPSRSFEPKDIAGIWTPNGAGYGGGRCRDCGDRGFSLDFPTFTAAGQAAFDANIPSYGRAKDGDDAKAHPEEHVGRRRAQPPALGNDPYQTCNPMGLPRAILYPDPVEFLVLKDRILQHFEWGYGLRTIWMDGRRLPKPGEIDLPRWWGYAVGRWDGNTLVVTSTGHDDRTWVDHFGYPHSDQMVLEERYTRINFDTIELEMVLTDPEYYAKPWVAQTKRMHLLPQNYIQSSGWSGLLEDLCAPVDEVDTFNRLIRDPAGTGKPAAPPRR